MLVVGLTGGIGSGKSMVASLFAERGVPIIDADVIAHEVSQPGKPATAEIIEHFGASVALPDGALNRAQLRTIIFAQPNERLWLERLLHPAIRMEMEKQIGGLSAPYCIAVIPLLLEVEFYFFINRILVVDTPGHLQIERVMTRDKTDKVAIEAILKTQASREDRVARAHDVIVNDGRIEDLVPQVEKLHRLYLDLGTDK